MRDSLAAERYKAEVEREASWRGGARDEGDAQNENLPDAMPPHKEYRSEMQPHVALSQYREAGEDATTATNKSDVLRSELDCLPAQNSPGGEDAIHGADTPAAALQRARQMAERWAGQAQPNLW